MHALSFPNFKLNMPWIERKTNCHGNITSPNSNTSAEGERKIIHMRIMQLKTISNVNINIWCNSNKKEEEKKTNTSKHYHHLTHNQFLKSTMHSQKHTIIVTTLVLTNYNFTETIIVKQKRK